MIARLLLFSTLALVARGSDHQASGPQEAPAHREAAATEAEELQEEVPGTIYVRESPKEIMIPSKIWDLIYPDDKNKPRVVFVPIKVQMKEKNPGILVQEEVIVQFPRGGGEIDLSQFVKDKRGSFFVRFAFETGSTLETSYVYFVSRNRKRKVDGVILGSGCKSFYSVKTYLGKTDSKGGILVNTTRLRHLSVLGGSFVFANVAGKEVRLAQVSFKDSKRPKYFCDSKNDSKNDKDGVTSDESSESL